MGLEKEEELLLREEKFWRRPRNRDD